MAHVDWLTIVGWRGVEQTDWTVNSAYVTAAQTLMDRSSTFIEAVGNPDRWPIVKPRAPYSFARRSEDNTRTLYVHPLSAHFTLELSGQWCKANAQHLPILLKDFAEWVKRIDLAVDMETSVTPLEFDEKVSTERIKTRSRMQSSTGQTVYIGSRSSERFCRVYRYFPPHPRAHLLRAEFQLKGEYANAYAEEIAAGVTLNSLAAGLGENFGFTHECWNPAETPKVVSVPSHPQSGATVAYLTKTIAPLLRRLEREHKLDVRKWFDTYVINYE